VDQEVDAGNRRWLPELKGPCTEWYHVTLPANMKPGTYELKFRLHSPEAERDVLVALQPGLRDDAGYYRIGSVEVSP
jgi:hypothetical protein